MKHNTTFADTTIVAFHIGRGGRFNNAGHLSFIGAEKIGKFTEDLFPRYENQNAFKNRFGFDQTYNSRQKCILDLITDENFDELEEKFGITLEMLGEVRYYDAAGHDTGLTESECQTGVGRIEIDGNYNTTYACPLSDCNEQELQLIVGYNGYVDSAIVDYAKDQLGIVDEEEEAIED